MLTTKACLTGTNIFCHAAGAEVIKNYPWENFEITGKETLATI